LSEAGPSAAPQDDKQKNTGILSGETAQNDGTGWH